MCMNYKAKQQRTKSAVSGVLFFWMTIEYDITKNQTNIRMHGISFVTASSTYDAPNAMLTYIELLAKALIKRYKEFFE